MKIDKFMKLHPLGKWSLSTYYAEEEEDKEEDGAYK